MNPQGNEWNLLNLQSMKVAVQARVSMIHHILVRKFIPMPQAMKIPYAIAAVDKEWKKARNDSSMATGESQD